MRILGIDPGLRIAGYGCVEFKKGSARPTMIEAGALKLTVKESVPFRLSELYGHVKDVIEELQPELLAVETIFTHQRQVTAATILGYARGVILLAGEQASLPLLELTPATIKKAITGNGRASKPQMQEAVKGILDLKEVPKPPDIADALGIAITAALRQ